MLYALVLTPSGATGIRLSVFAKLSFRTTLCTLVSCRSVVCSLSIPKLSSDISPIWAWSCPETFHTSTVARETRPVLPGPARFPNAALTFGNADSPSLLWELNSCTAFRLKSRGTGENFSSISPHPSPEKNKPTHSHTHWFTYPYTNKTISQTYLVSAYLMLLIYFVASDALSKLRHPVSCRPLTVASLTIK